MAQGTEELRAQLADLHRQLQGTRSVSGDVRELLVEVLGDIDRVLTGETEAQASIEPAGAETPGGADLESNPLARRLGEAARQFEDTHPQLAANVGSLVTALSRLGI
jgi:hypothetical protein